MTQQQVTEEEKLEQATGAYTDVELEFINRTGYELIEPKRRHEAAEDNDDFFTKLSADVRSKELLDWQNIAWNISPPTGLTLNITDDNTVTTQPSFLNKWILQIESEKPTIILDTGWDVVLPEDVGLLIGPIDGEDRWESVTEYYEPGETHSIHIPLILDGETKINTSEPLAKVVPIDTDHVPEESEIHIEKMESIKDDLNEQRLAKEYFGDTYEDYYRTISYYLLQRNDIEHEEGNIDKESKEVENFDQAAEENNETEAENTEDTDDDEDGDDENVTEE